MQQQERILGFDRISHLPDPLLTSVLSFLPIKEAARTSVLSHRWKSLWLSLPRLILSESLGFKSSASSPAFCSFHSVEFDPKRWLSSAHCILLARILSPHRHPVIHCGIRFKSFTEYNFLFDGFLLFLCSSGIKTLDLFNGGDYYHLPIHIFFCCSLQSLTLYKCAVRFPVKFTGWSAMKEIYLTSTFICDSDLDMIFSSCRALETFYLEGCEGFEKLVVRAPKLLYLIVCDAGELAISLEDAPNIVFLRLWLQCFMQRANGEDDGYNLFEILKIIPKLESLYLEYFQLSEEPIAVVKERIQLPLHLHSDNVLRNLSKLQLYICLADADLIQLLYSLLCSAPNLHELMITDFPWINSDIDSAYWDKHHVPDCLKHHLSYVKLEYVDLNCESVVKFIQFLLMNACALQRIIVICDNSRPQPSSAVEDELQGTQRASSQAVLKFRPSDCL